MILLYQIYEKGVRGIYVFREYTKGDKVIKSIIICLIFLISIFSGTGDDEGIDKYSQEIYSLSITTGKRWMSSGLYLTWRGEMSPILI